MILCPINFMFQFKSINLFTKCWSWNLVELENKLLPLCFPANHVLVSDYKSPCNLKYSIIQSQAFVWSRLESKKSLEKISCRESLRVILGYELGWYIKKISVAVIWTWAGGVRSVNATSVLCRPPFKNRLALKNFVKWACKCRYP